jgi:hypothetical protein
MNSDTTIDDIEYILNKYESDHTMAYFLIEEVIRNYRNIQLDKFQYEQTIVPTITENNQNQLNQINQTNQTNRTNQNQPLVTLPTIQPTTLKNPQSIINNQHNYNYDSDEFNINDYDIYGGDDNSDNNSDDETNNYNYKQINNYNQNVLNKNKTITKSSATKPISNNQIPTKPKTFECLCCYDLFSDDEITTCSEGHIFCKECVKKYACQLVYENCNANITCINVGGKCDGIFDEKNLENILDQRVMNEYRRVKTQNELKEISNSIDDINIKICANCEKGIDVGDFELEQLFCTECGKETCLKCNQLVHEGKPCFANGNVRTDKRLELEDKMTEELLIRCDNCHKMIYKDQGCNKVTCTCKTTMCAICKKNITKEGYTHFSKSDRCKLHTDENAKKKKVINNLASGDKEESKLLKSLI